MNLKENLSPLDVLIVPINVQKLLNRPIPMKNKLFKLKEKKDLPDEITTNYIIPKVGYFENGRFTWNGKEKIFNTDRLQEIFQNSSHF